LSGAWVVPALVGPAIAGAVTDAVGWRWVFFGVAPFAALGAVLLAPVLRSLPDLPAGASPQRLGLAGGTLLAGGLALIQLAGQTLRWSSLALLAAGAALGA